MQILFLASLAIFIFTLFFVIKRPRNIGIGYSALIGAALSVLLGITSLHDVVVVWNIVWNATFTFVAIIIASLVFDDAGFFEYLALRIAKFSGGNARMLFILIILLGAGISAVFANDGTALVLTPIVVAIVYRSGFDSKHVLPFVMATGFIADTASIPFTISNLVNIISASYFSIPFLIFALKMILPDVVSILATVVFVWLYYRKAVPSRFAVESLAKPESAIKDPLVFKLAIPVIVTLVALYSIGGIFNVPIAFIALPGVTALFLVAKFHGKIDTTKILLEAPWQIVLFSLGMYIVVFGLGAQGLTQYMSSLILFISKLGNPASIVFSGVIFGLTAAIMNNLPSVMLGNLAIAGIHGPLTLVYANVIGNDIGPKFTPIGSLATLLWLYTLERKRGVRITPREYMKAGFIIAMPVLVITLLALAYI
ncbi:MAG: arsenical efflux pump membrane protein ArsB [Thermoplasmataceae archaeon]